MSLFKKLFEKKEETIKNHEDFWNWFLNNEKKFFDIIKKRENIEKGFFDKLSPKLTQLKEGFFFVCGMPNENTAELILTADGNVKNIVFVEELVNAAPTIKGWKFTGLKPALKIENVTIEMEGYVFNSNNISF